MAIEPASRATRRQWVLLGVLIVVLVLVLGYMWGGGWGGRAPTSGTDAASSAQRRGRAQGAGKSGPEGELDVKLDELQAEREKPSDIERNPFRFEARRRAEPPAGEGGDVPPSRMPQPEPEPPPMPSGPPPPPPIPLKFIGIIESPQAGRLAALSDGHRVFQGRAGDIIEGRYRIVRIGVESIVMEYADGSGPQQTIRLSGQ